MAETMGPNNERVSPYAPENTETLKVIGGVKRDATAIFPQLGGFVDKLHVIGNHCKDFLADLLLRFSGNGDLLKKTTPLKAIPEPPKHLDNDDSGMLL